MTKEMNAMRISNVLYDGLTGVELLSFRLMTIIGLSYERKRRQEQGEDEGRIP